MFIPLYDGKPLINIHTAWVNWGLIALNVAVFLFYQLPAGIDASALSFGLIPALVNDFARLPAEAIRIPADMSYLSYAFLHGSALHLGGNMVFLWVFGDNIEDAMGHLKYAIFYCVSAIVAGFAHSQFFLHAEAPLVGASGAVAGIVAAYLVLHPKMRIWVLAFGKIPLPISAFWCLGAWVIMQFVFFSSSQDNSPVSWIAHIGGILTGVILVVFLRHPHIPLFDRDLRSRSIHS